MRHEPARDRHMQQLLSPVDVKSIGAGFAGNTVNTVIFRAHGLLTAGTWQFGAYYVATDRLVVFRRSLETDIVETANLPGTYRIEDAHDSISLGIDREGYLHISCDHHGTPLRYRRSKVPFEIAAFGSEIPMTGADEQQVTYPSFIVSPYGDRPLLCLYRTGYAGRGEAVLNAYDEKTQTWTRIASPLLSGTHNKPWTSSPYWNHPATEVRGIIHLSFCWRTHTLEGERKLVNNINIDYAQSGDWGKTWRTSCDVPFQLPITQVNSETILGLPPGSNLINQTGSGIDSQGNLHVVFYADDENGIPQYQHVWGRKGFWRRNVISARGDDFSLEGAGSLQLPMSRPEVVVDELDRVYVIFRADFTGQRMAAMRLTPPEYTPHQSEIRILWDTNVAFTEPVIDHVRWAREKILTMLMQRNDQPAYDIGMEPTSANVFVLDWNLGKDWN